MKKKWLYSVSTSRVQIISQEEMYEELCFLAANSRGRKQKRLQALAEDFAPAVPKAAKKKVVKKTTKAATKSPTRNSVIREWAAANGYTVGNRGMIPANVVEAYEAATTKSTKPQNVEADEPTTVEAPSAVADLESALDGIGDAVRTVTAPADHLAPQRTYPASKQSRKQRQRTR